jgi:hypothetical protein
MERCLGTRSLGGAAFGCSDVWVQAWGCLGAGMFGCRGVRVPRCLGARSLGGAVVGCKGLGCWVQRPRCSGAAAFGCLGLGDSRNPTKSDTAQSRRASTPRYPAVKPSPATAHGTLYQPTEPAAPNLGGRRVAVAARRSRQKSVLCKTGRFSVSGDRRRADAKTAGAPAGSRVCPTYFALESPVGSPPLGRAVD